MSRRGLVTTGTAAFAAILNPLAMFDRLAPQDGDGRMVARDIAYGPDPRQKLDLYAPARPTGSGPLPVLVFFYGGGWDTGTKAYYRWVGRAFAAKGFLVAMPDYRLVPEVHFPAFLDDGASAIAKVREIAAANGGDPERLVTAGHSAGAYIAVMLALDTEYLKRAGAPADSIRAAAGLAGPYDFYPFDVPASVNAFGQAPDPKMTQPITFARGDAPPLLLATGDADTTVRPRNSIALSKAVTARGGQAELKLYPGVGHVKIVLALSTLFRGSVPVLGDVSRFLLAHAGAEAQVRRAAG